MYTKYAVFVMVCTLSNFLESGWGLVLTELQLSQTKVAGGLLSSMGSANAMFLEEGFQTRRTGPGTMICIHTRYITCVL